MFFIYGKKPVVLNEIIPKTTSCTFCESMGTVSLISHSTHVHLYYVPIFPLGVKVTSYCSSCTCELKEKEFPNLYKSHSDIVRNGSKTPLWQYSGVALIVSLIIFFTVRSQITSQNEALYLSQPLKGDVYHYKLDFNQYSTFKIASINGDSVFFHHNSMEANTPTMLSELNKEENYEEELLYMFTRELDSIYNEGNIIDIIRTQ